MSRKTYPITKKGLEKLKQELLYLETDKRNEINNRVKKARSFCDFHEDPEYDAAVAELASIQERISNMKQMIQHAKIIPENIQSETVQIGHTVTILFIKEGTKETYTIVGTTEADPFEAKISYHSPIAKKLLGAKINEEIRVETPEGEKLIKVIEII